MARLYIARPSWPECCCIAALIAHALNAAPSLGQTLAAPTGLVQQIHMASGPRGNVPLMSSANGTQVTMPLTPAPRNRLAYSRQSGFQLSVDLSWPGQYGYRPVVFTLRRQKPTVADQRITVTFSVGDWVPPREEAMNVTQHFTFPAGATSASERVLVPRYQDWQVAGWRVLVDGRSDNLLAVDQIHFGGFAQMQSGLGLMGLGLTAQQESQCTRLLQTVASGTTVSMQSLTAAELPDDWREYSSLDVFVMPADKARVLADFHPQRLEALLRWVAAGGNLWLLDAGNRWEKLPSVERALGIDYDVRAADDLSADDAVVERGWRFAPVGERAAEPSQGALLLAGFDTGQPKRLPSVVRRVLDRFKGASWARQFAVRGHGLGVITAFRGTLDDIGNEDDAVDSTNTADPMAGMAAAADPMMGYGADPAAQDNSVDQDAYAAITQSLLGPRITWTSRHGNQPESTNDDFNKLLIPGVGVAPVGYFQFLVTLFVIAIGPLNYWLLRRKNKLPMLLATVPIAAALTTFVLFMYGLFADGFGVLARARTLTLLDQTAGEAVAWGRLSYYAGISPSGGLTVPSDQLMYPVLPRWLSRRYGGRASSAPRYLEWQQEQQLKRGWLLSRTPTQYQAVASRPSTKRLAMRVTDAGLRIDNRLGVDVTHLAVEDHDGRFYWCENLPAGNRKIVPATDQNTLASGIRRLFTDNIPESPGGDEVGYSGYGYGGYALSQSLMEGRLEAINDPAIQSWGRGKYIAFTQHAVELDLGLDDVDEQASFHVIEGTW